MPRNKMKSDGSSKKVEIIKAAGQFYLSNLFEFSLVTTSPIIGIFQKKNIVEVLIGETILVFEKSQFKESCFVGMLDSNMERVKQFENRKRKNENSTDELDSTYSEKCSQNGEIMIQTPKRQKCQRFVVTSPVNVKELQVSSDGIEENSPTIRSEFDDSQQENENTSTTTRDVYDIPSDESFDYEENEESMSKTDKKIAKKEQLFEYKDQINKYLLAFTAMEKITVKSNDLKSKTIYSEFEEELISKMSRDIDDGDNLESVDCIVMRNREGRSFIISGRKRAAAYSQSTTNRNVTVKLVSEERINDYLTRRALNDQNMKTSMLTKMHALKHLIASCKIPKTLLSQHSVKNICFVFETILKIVPYTLLQIVLSDDELSELVIKILERSDVSKKLLMNIMKAFKKNKSMCIIYIKNYLETKKCSEFELREMLENVSWNIGSILKQKGVKPKVVTQVEQAFPESPEFIQFLTKEVRARNQRSTKFKTIVDLWRKKRSKYTGQSEDDNHSDIVKKSINKELVLTTHSIGEIEQKYVLHNIVVISLSPDAVDDFTLRSHVVLPNELCSVKLGVMQNLMEIKIIEFEDECVTTGDTFVEKLYDETKVIIKQAMTMSELLELAALYSVTNIEMDEVEFKRFGEAFTTLPIVRSRNRKISKIIDKIQTLRQSPDFADSSPVD